MAKKNKKTMTDNQFAKAIEELNKKTPIKLRGGRAPVIIIDKKREAEKNSCRKKVIE